ncbi:hypothetical protein BDB01DRAFT_778204 [Pilobolus umbonatus]|nr:hypothetical protein BDB01DRAFT_778204 [Pilobolus umbonatus]
MSNKAPETTWLTSPTKYTNLKDRQLIKALRQSSEVESTPTELRQFFKNIVSYADKQEEELTEDKEILEKYKSQCDKYATYITNANENYNHLHELYQIKYQELQKASELLLEKDQQLKESIAKVEKQQVLLEEQNRLYKDQLEKQAVGRKQIEMDALKQMQKLNEATRRCTELETRNSYLNTQIAALYNVHSGCQHPQQPQQSQPQQRINNTTNRFIA